MRIIASALIQCMMRSASGCSRRGRRAGSASARSVMTPGLPRACRVRQMRARRGRGRAVQSARREGRRPPGKLRQQQRKRARIVDVVPAGHVDDRQPDLAGARDGAGVHLRGAPGNVDEQPVMHAREADQRVAAIERRTEHHGILTPHRLDGGAQDRGRQRRAVGVHQDRAGMASAAARASRSRSARRNRPRIAAASRKSAAAACATPARCRPACRPHSRRQRRPARARRWCRRDRG